MKAISSLDDLMNGAAVERFNKCLKEVLNNIFDPNTDAKKTRKITMTLTIKPDKSRNSAKFYLDVRSGLAPIEPYEVNTMLSRDDRGNVSAAEFGNQIPGQTSIDDVETAPDNVKPFVIGGRR
ncbi:MAG: replication terminator protein [Clostridia bacterium]|nr:replication terminator protein [Clostridia bacterium]MDO5378024.1 replication terminator protein [Clostridia bacterium]